MKLAKRLRQCAGEGQLVLGTSLSELKVAGVPAILQRSGSTLKMAEIDMNTVGYSTVIWMLLKGATRYIADVQQQMKKGVVVYGH